MDVLALDLPIPQLEHPFTVRIPRPSPLPAVPSEEDLQKVELQLERAIDRHRRTDRPGLKHRRDGDRPDLHTLKRTINRLQSDIDSGRLNERATYDAIINLHLLNKALADFEGQKQATGAVWAFEHALLLERLVGRYLKHP